MSVPLRADEIQIGSGSQTDANLPTHSYFKYSLTQQIYTATEIEGAGGGAGTINSIAFYNGGSAKTRNFSIYLVNTDKESFSGNSDWITVSANDMVFSGNVDMTANVWTTITFSTPFSYDGGNLAVVVDDNTGNDVSGMSCRIFTASSTQSIYYRNDGTNPDPTNPTISGIPTTNKNQIILDIDMASVTCAKPKNFTASNIAAHTATLTWTAGAEGQSNWDVYVTTSASDVPDENTLPTYQVTECTKSLSGLSTQTTYYTYVRSACGGDDGNSKWASTSFTTTREALTIDAENPYSQNFENNNDWTLVNGTYTNQWCWGSATNNGGEKAMYISKDGGTTYEYAHNELVVYASKLFSFAQGTYTFSFDWKANGESSYDFLRVALVPGDKTFTAGGSLPSGVTASGLPSDWIALDGGSKLNQSNDWQTKVAEIDLSSTYTMVFLWRNDGSGGSQPPAAIDNISISYMTCPRPTNLTASNVTGRTAVLTWKENGTADSWTLQYATDANFSANLVEITDEFIVNESNVGFGLTGLSGETKYYVRVKSNCDSSWSDVINFTTAATCEKPTLSYVTNSNTAHSGSVSWTGNADNYELIYSTAYSFEPGDEGVTQINLGSVNTYTLQDLAPETTYRIKVRANCGEEDGYSAWSNQVSFTTTATCIAPSGLSATATANTITLSWTAGTTGQDAWDIRYKTGSDDYTYVHLDGQTTTNYTITNLTPVTTYSVNVRAYCSDEDQSKWGYSTNQNSDLAVSTECAAIALPYSYGFEENLNTAAPYSSSYPMPKCWNAIRYQYGSNSPYTYYPYVCSTTNNSNYGPRTGGKFLFLYKTPNLTNEIAVLPEIDANINEVQLRFWGRNGNGSSAYPEVLVGVMTDPTNASTFEQVESVSVSTKEYTEYTVDFSGYTGSGMYIAFKLNPAYSSYSYTYFSIDDITIESTLSCLTPTMLEASIEDEQSAVLNWTPTSNETAWNLQYKKASENEWGETFTVEQTTYTLSALERATTYEARVQANCGENDQSDWTESISFTTDCGILTVDDQHPFYEDFNSAVFPPTCWQKVNFGEMGETNGWQVNINNNLDNQGAVSSDFKGETWLFLPHMHIEGNATLSFDNLFTSGNNNVPCSVMLSTTQNMNVEDIKTEGFIAANFTQIWIADENNLPATKTNETINLSNYSGQDVYIAFRYEGNNSNSQIVWYIDNVHVYVGEIFTKDIAAYSGDGGYYLIASPTGEVNPENVTNMLSNSYDLYRFNQSALANDQGVTLEWENYKQEGENYHFNLEPGKGYLYANDHDVTLRFTGVAYSGEGKVTLTKTDNVDWSGWNLVGNPFAQTAYITKPFYTMNGTGSEVVAGTGNSVEAMEGVFVIANQNGEEMTFSTTEPSMQNQQLVINVTRSRGASTGSATTSTGSATIDRAIVRFGEESALPKFQLNPTHTKVYIPQEGKNYAIVRSATQGEMPLNFKAEKNGTYTLSFSNEEVTFSYLHLIDNLTGADVDLLQQSNYTFDARMSDYASRFRLVFAADGANEDVCEPNFAYYNGSNWTVSGPSTGSGAATLQVIDVMGRVLSTETISGNAEIHINQASGVYMLRLVTDDSVKVQKVVVR